MEKIKRYELFEGDCLDLMNNIDDKSIDLIICDLPYGTTACRWDTIIDLEKLWIQYNRIIKDRGMIVLFSAQPFTTKLINSNIKNYKYSWYWIKNNVTGFNFAKYQPMRKVEDINIFYKSKPLYIPQGIKKIENSRIRVRKPGKRESIYDEKNTLCNKEYIQKYTNYPNNVLYFNKDSKCQHPTQKPVDLLKYLINTYTREEMIVLDNCMGSGSTGVACAELNRRFIGMESDNEYFKIAKLNIQKSYKENRNE
ncbi:DNA-methyltransferase [Peptostreptococcus equinus]|uniref:Methyltransferase n=1 Tax=Peptostreptococcus equinus TaxID=3003601 RepID=A0ABY7JRP9_9FIRM|nr:site-specific DNA-methyltransferase [Peptostreptococcus sp. CBA3647]WAW14733.1 site-specific DNA-methyltransferase [Peptostreptococcus sp. CBA3647]